MLFISTITIMNTVVCFTLSFLCCSEPRCSCTYSEDRLKANCSHLNLQTEPIFTDKVSVIDLSFNNLQHFPVFNATSLNLYNLDLSHNSITNFNSSLEEYSFPNLTNLVYLNISSNFIPLHKNVYFDTIFSDLTNLETLDISNNSRTDYGEYPDATFSHLVSLKKMVIDGLTSVIMEKGFGKLKNLTSLRFSGHCDIQMIPQSFFVFLSRLEEVDVSSCSLNSIEMGSFASLRNLRSLDISYNRKLGLCGFRNVTQDLKYTAVEIFKANYLHCTLGMNTMLMSNDLKPLQNTNIREIYLNGNKFQIMDYAAFMYFPRNLELLEVKDNAWSIGYYFIYSPLLSRLKTVDLSFYPHTINDGLHLKFCDDSESIEKCTCERQDHDSKKLSNLEGQNASDRYSYHDFSIDGDSKVFSVHPGYILQEEYKAMQIQTELKRIYQGLQSNILKSNKSHHNYPIKKQDYKNECCSLTTYNHISVPIPPNLKHVKARNGRYGKRLPYLWLLFDTLREIDIQGNDFERLEGPVCNASKVENVDFSHNGCYYISPQFFCGLTGLRRLNLQGNMLGNILRKEESCVFFKDTRKLEKLDLSENKLTNIPKCLLENTYQLQEINLGSNLITDWNISINTIYNLSRINLSDNVISALSQRGMDLLDRSKSNKLVIDLSNNNFICSCESLAFLRWIRSTSSVVLNNKGSYSCTFSDGTVRLIEDVFFKLQKSCSKSSELIQYIIISTVAVALIIVIVVLIINHYIWKLRHWFYITNLSCKRDNYRSMSKSDDYKYAVYVSFSDSENEFVVNELAKYLESENLRLCLPERDFVPGTSMPSNIINGINCSKRMICIITEDYIKSEWCMYELNIGITESAVSRNGCNMMMLLLKDYTPTVSNTPKEIMNFLRRNNTYLEYPENEEEKGFFWRTFVDIFTREGIEIIIPPVHGVMCSR